MQTPLKLNRSFVAAFAATIVICLPPTQGRAAELHIGGASVSLTPNQPVALSGKMNTRIAKTVGSPVTATALPTFIVQFAGPGSYVLVITQVFVGV